MSHYQKLACLGVRLISLITFLIGILWIAFGTLGLLSPNNSPDANPGNTVLWAGLIYIVAAVAAYFLAKPAGRFLGRNLDN